MAQKKDPASAIGAAGGGGYASILSASDNRQSALKRLPMLAGFAPLLPGKPDKRPSVGDNWPDHPGLSVEQLAAANPTCICWHIGADVNHIAVDVDGALAAAFCQSHDCDPSAADTWRITRTGNTDRLKLVFTVTPEQKATLVAGAKSVKIEGQELAVFAKPGTQIVVLGNHYTKESNFTENDDQYAWAGRAPSDAQPMPPEWFALLTGVFCGERPLKPPTVRQVSAPSSRKANAYSNRGGWGNSSQQQPCPMCGRDHSGACSISRDRDSVWCCHGETKSAPDCSKAGETITGSDGRIWAYVRTEEHDSFGERSLFVLHKPPQDGRESSAGTSKGKSTIKAGLIVKAEAVERNDEQPESTAPKHSQLLSTEEVKARLRVEISEGIGAADLAALVAELSTASGLSAFIIQGMANAIRDEHQQATAIAVEAQQFAAEADRQEIGQVLTASYLLPPVIADALDLRTRYLPCEGPSVVIPFLAAVGGLAKLGTRVEASAVAGYDVPINVFACLVGNSGQKKTPVGKLTVDEPTRDLRAEMAAANRAAIEAWRQESRQTKKNEPKPDSPKLKRLMVSDFTGEALADQLQTQEEAGLGLLIHRDEIRGMFSSLNAYRKGKGGDEEQLLEMFDGGGCNSLRVTSGGRFYNRSQVSIYGSTQPDVLRELVAQGDANGLWARFLFVPLPARAIPLPLSSTDEEKAAVTAAAKTLADACRAVYRLPPQTYKLSPQAAERFQHFEHCRQLAAQRTTIGAQGALYGKSAGKVLRLAGALHLLEIATQRTTSSAPISADIIDRAAAMVDHLDAWALSLHAEVAAGGVGQLMRTVHRAAEAAAEPIRWKELACRLSTKQRSQIDVAGFAEAAQALAAAGYGEVETGERGAIIYRSTRPLP